MAELRYFIAADGACPFEDWFLRLDATAAAKITVVLARLEQGNFSNVKGVGSGVYEFRMDWGPGYRLYFGYDGEKIIILLTGGTKKRQQKDIITAHSLWKEYKHVRKSEE
jgi:putative addiction module killer protein